ncbi:MAG: hypothetical protein R6V56_08975, partial [Lentisphaeria bacterium]
SLSVSNIIDIASDTLTSGMGIWKLNSTHALVSWCRVKSHLQAVKYENNTLQKTGSDLELSGAAADIVIHRSGTGITASELYKTDNNVYIINYVTDAYTNHYFRFTYITWDGSSLAEYETWESPAVTGADYTGDSQHNAYLVDPNDILIIFARYAIVFKYKQSYRRTTLSKNYTSNSNVPSVQLLQVFDYLVGTNQTYTLIRLNTTIQRLARILQFRYFKVIMQSGKR